MNSIRPGEFKVREGGCLGNVHDKGRRLLEGVLSRKTSVKFTVKKVTK